MSYFVFYCNDSYLYPNCSGSITSAGEERANFCNRLLVMLWFPGISICHITLSIC